MNLEQLIKDYLKMCSLQNNLDKKTIKAYRTDLRQFKILSLLFFSFFQILLVDVS